MEKILKILSWLRYGIFILFYLLSARLIFISLDSTPIKHLPLLVILCLGIVSLSLWRVLWGLYFFVVAIPLVSGLQLLGLLKPIPTLSLIFASFYCCWLTKKILLKREGIDPRTGIGDLVDLLSGITFISLIFTLGREPINFILNRIDSSPTSVMDPIYSIQAAYILLQGLFFYRILEQEVESQRTWTRMFHLLYLQCLIIIFFSMIQLISHTPNLYLGFALYSPFDDIHSYGSYIVTLFFINIGQLLKESPRYKILLGIYIGILSLLIVLSYSRATWISMSIILIFLVIYKLPIPKRLLLILCILLFLFWANLFPEIFVESKSIFLKRLGNLVAFKYQLSDHSRIILWKRAIHIIGDFPLTGSGIGTFFKISPLYHNPKIKAFQNFYENAHNYFLQFTSDLGIPALLILLSILFFTYKTGLQLSSKNPKIGLSIKALLLGLSAYLLTCLTGHPLLISSQQFFFWFIIASIMIPQIFLKSYRVEKGVELPKKTRLFSAVLLIMILMGYGLEYGIVFFKDSIKNRTYEYGFYHYEDWKGKKVRWTSKKAALYTIVTGQVISFDIYVFPHNIGPKGLDLEIFINGKVWDKLNFLRAETRSLKYYIPFKKGELIEIKFVVSQTFIPFLLGINQDKRKLGVAMSEVIFYDEF